MLVMSEFEPLAAAPSEVRAVAAVLPPVPPEAVPSGVLRVSAWNAGDGRVCAGATKGAHANAAARNSFFIDQSYGAKESSRLRVVAFRSR